MKNGAWLLFCSALFAPASASGATELSWRDLAKSQPLPDGVELVGDNLLVRNAEDAPRTFKLFVLRQPALTQLQWRLDGRVRHESVEGEGYLELLNVFSSGTYFTRTLSDRGEMAKLRGSSDWRRFSLPFDATSGGEPPRELILNVALPGRGTVELGPLTLHDGWDAGASAGAWWSDRFSGWFFGSLGALIGCLAGLISFLAQRGKARDFVLGSAFLLVVVSALLLVAGVVALALGQPYGVYYPLLLLGILGVAIMGTRIGKLRAQYQELELRKMSAMDATGR